MPDTSKGRVVVSLKLKIQFSACLEWLFFLIRNQLGFIASTSHFFFYTIDKREIDWAECERLAAYKILRFFFVFNCICICSMRESLLKGGFVARTKLSNSARRSEFAVEVFTTKTNISQDFSRLWLHFKTLQHWSSNQLLLGWLLLSPEIIYRNKISPSDLCDAANV